MKPNDYPIVEFKDPYEWEEWLEKNHETVKGVWLRFYKKSSNVIAINYDQALDWALCYGWIDSQVKKYDDISYLHKFTPRRSKGLWSKINTQHIERLIKEGRMKPAGLKQVEEAKKDGRWTAAYDSSATMQVPEDFLKELSQHPKAEAFFKTFNKTNTYAIAWRLQTAKKQETRDKRMKAIIEKLVNGERLY